MTTENEKIEEMLEKAQLEATKNDYHIPDFLDLKVLSERHQKDLYDLVMDSYKNYAIKRTNYFAKAIYQTTRQEVAEEILKGLYEDGEIGTSLFQKLCKEYGVE